MIISDKVLTHLLPFSQPDVFELEVSKNIVRWITDYYERYKVAPKKHIKDLYESEKGKLKQGLDEEVGLFLAKISEEYLSEGGPDGVNEDFLIDKGREYLKVRHLRRVAEGINSLLDIGKNEEAEKFYESNKKIVDEVTYNWAKPLDDPNFLNMVFEEKDVPLFRMKGKLGDLLGDFHRGWLFAVMGPTKRGKCIAKGSLIPLSNGGLVPIERVKEGDFVITLNDKLKLESKKVNKLYDNGDKPVFSVTTRTGREIQVTNNHPFLTITGWKTLEEIGEGDFIAVPKYYPIFGKKLMVGYEVRLLAYLLAEGCIGSGGSGNTPTFTNKDPEIQEDFIEIIELHMNDWANRDKLNPIQFRIVGRYHPTKTEGRQGPKTNTKVWYKKLGLKETKSKFKEIPDVVFQLRKSCLSMFLSILFCCDGSIWKDRNQIIINYSSASEIFVKQIQHLLLRFGIFGRVTGRRVNDHNDHIYWEITIKDRKNSLKFLKEIGFIIGYKKEYTKKFLNEIENKKDGRSFLDNFPKIFTDSIITPEIKKFIKNNGKQSRLWWHTRSIGNVERSHREGTALTRPIISELATILGSEILRKYSESQIIWDRIIKIIPKGFTNTFDLTIEGNHNFIANDIVVHNSWLLQDIAFDAMLSRKRVVYMSFEMKDKHQAARMYKQLGVMGEENSEEYIFPCFDCMNNQDNSCNNATRMNGIAAPPKFDPKAPGTYRPCTACRKIPGGGNFLATTWFFVAERPKLTLPNTRKEIKKFQKVFGKNLLRIISFPAYSATMADVEDQLDELERVEGFIPDVIITDYASIIRPEQKYNDPRHDVEDVFKAHKRMAQTRSVLVVTGAQSLGAGRAAFKKDMQDEGDIGLNAYILSHVDIMMTLDQTPDEKEKGIWRMGVIEHRWKQFNKRRQVMALQQLELGMPVLDTEMIYYKSGEKKDE